MYAFLFDARHEELAGEALYGPPCTKRVVSALESLASLPTSHLIWGDVMPHAICADLSSVSGQHRTHSYSVNSSRLKTVVCDLAEALSEPPSTVHENVLLLHLARGVVWMVGVSNLSEQDAALVDQDLRGFPPYIGMAKVDQRNPIQWQVMVRQMISDRAIISPGGVAYKIEAGLPREDRADAKQVAALLGSKRRTTLLTERSFRSILPPMVQPALVSDRGELSHDRYSGKIDSSHRQRLAKALLGHFEKWHSSGEIEFVAKLNHGAQKCEIPPEKFTDYLLNRNHPVGHSKAKFFIDYLGILPEDWNFLADQIKQGLESAPIYRVRNTQWGFNHGAILNITGRNGRNALLETGWQVAPRGAARFVTAYPFDGLPDEAIEVERPYVVEAGLVGDQRLEAIYRRAVEAAEHAAGTATPTPMVVEGFGTQWGGECGFAFVTIPDARSSVSRWLLRTQRQVRKTYPGVSIPADTPCQSVERKRAWAEAFALVLRANGIECRVESWLD